MITAHAMHASYFTYVCFFREQLNKILCVFFDKADQYRSCIQSDNSKMVGVVVRYV